MFATAASTPVTHFESALLLQEGSILDATIIHAPSYTKNKKAERDPEMHSVAKGNQWYFEMRCHIGVDSASGLVHSVVGTAANVYELNTAAERLHGEEKVVYGNSGHLGIEKRQEFEDNLCQFRIVMRPGQRRALPDTPEGGFKIWLRRQKPTGGRRWNIPFG